MRNFSPSPIKIDLGFSIWLAVYLLVAHLLALILILLLELELSITLGLLALILSSLVFYVRKELLHLRPNSVIGVEWSEDRGWLIRQNNGSNLNAELCPTSFVSRWLVVLHLNTKDSGRQRVAIPVDATDSDRFRRLRVLLKTHNHFGV